MQESALRELLGEEKFAQLLHSTCCVCGKIAGKDEEVQKLSCGHSICGTCVRDQSVKEKVKLSASGSLIYDCRICGHPYRLSIVQE